jgi:rubredoxin
MVETLHICAVCAFEYEQTADAQPDFHELSTDWQCPGCGISIDMFHHYSCHHIVAEMTGKFGSSQPFTTVELKRIQEF